MSERDEIMFRPRRRLRSFRFKFCSKVFPGDKLRRKRNGKYRTYQVVSNELCTNPSGRGKYEYVLAVLIK